jgi:hypothetical protein
VKLYVATALCIASLLAGFTGGWLVQGWRLGLQAHAKAVDMGKATIRQLDRAAQETATLQEAKDHAITQANARAQNHRRAADAARAELDGLRHDLAAPGPAGGDALACAATAERARTLAELFGNCAADLESLAAKADRHAIDALSLYEGWPRRPPADLAPQR